MNVKPLSVSAEPSVKNGNVIHRKPALRHHLVQIPVAQRITQVPPAAKDDDDVFEVSTAEQHWPVLAHGITLLEAARAGLQQILTVTSGSAQIGEQ